MVVVSGTWVKNVVSFPINGELITTAKMAAKAVLICRPNSHPFQERTLSLDQPVKIGRSVARARAVPNNAIFDCKVLSRNHALLWYENGKFYLQDTKSSNGTFVNNQRLSKGAEESPPREVCSGDIVQFGVDVMENARKVTHGCIVATVKLFLPDGKEAKASPSTSVVSSVGMVPLEDLYQLNIFVQEALQKDHMIENKLAALQKVVELTRSSSELAWKALIDEDRLLSRVETLETQLLTSSKNFGEDKLRDELRKLQDDKHQYQGTAKESLQKILEEKLEALLKLQALELNLSNSENECAHLKQLCDQGQQDLQELAQKFSAQMQKVEELTSKTHETEEQYKETNEKLEQEVRELQHRLEVQTELSRELQIRLDALQADGNLTQQKMADLQSHLQLLKSNEDNDGDVKEGLDINIGTTDEHPTDVILERIDPSMLENVKEEMEDLRYKLKNCQDELKKSRDLVIQLQGSTDMLTSELEGAEDDVKMARAHLEDLRNEEVMSQEKSLHLEERIDDIGLEIDLVSSDIDTNKCSEDDAPNSTGQISRLKAERANLQELLTEVRAKKKSTEEQREIYEQELNVANMKVKKITEDANLLKQHLFVAESELHIKGQAVLGLEEKIQQHESRLGDHSLGMSVLQEKVREEVQRANMHAAEAEALRKQLMEAQQIAKQHHNEAEQMKDRMKAYQNSQAEMETKLSSPRNSDRGTDNRSTDNRSTEELLTLRERCSTLEGELENLRAECSNRAVLARDLDLASARELELKRRLALAGLPRDVDQLEEELVEVKTNYTDLAGTIQKMKVDFEAYKATHPDVQSRMVEMLNSLPLMAIAITIFAMGFTLYFS